LSKSSDVAKKFLNNEGTLFIVETITARDISPVSVFPKEQEVLLMPYSALEVVKAEHHKGLPDMIYLREIPVPRGNKVVFWVDDNPENNLGIMHELEKKGISCVACVSTKDAIRVMSNYRWLLHMD